jgi:hypothetical protein
VLAALMLLFLAKTMVLAHPAVLPYYFLLTMNIANIPQSILLAPDASELNQLDRSRNAVWLEHRWLQGEAGEQELIALCARMKTHRIRYVYPHLSPANEDGRLPPFSQDAARQFRKVLRRECPDILALPWIGGVQSGYHQMRTGTIRLMSDAYLQTFASECVYLTDQLGFDGIHLNVEPVNSGNQRFLEWLEYIKSRIGRGKILSVAASKPAFIDGFNISPLRSWDLDYLEAVIRKCDQMVLMNYDTGISMPFLYSWFVYDRVAALLRRIHAAQAQCRFLLGIPTYDDAPNHRAAAENIEASCRGLSAALRRKDVPKQNFEGVALYAYWTTSESEWRQYLQYWAGPTNQP